MQINNLEFYAPDIRLIPYYNYAKFQKYLLLDAGLGNDLASVLQRVNTLQLFMQEGRDEDAQIEAGNLKLSLYSAIEGISWTSFALACLVKGVKLDTDEQVAGIAKQITDNTTEAELTDYLDELKKKIDFQLAAEFQQEQETGYLEALHKHTLLLLQSVISPHPDHPKQIKAAFSKVLDYCKPKILDLRIKGNAITAMDKNYIKTLAALKENNIHAENFTIFEMMTISEQVQDRNAKMQADIDKMKGKNGNANQL